MADPKPFCKALKEFWLQICRKRSTTEYQENRRTEEELFWSGARTAVLANLRIRYVKSVANAYINFALLSMLIGVAAGTFPGHFKCPLALSGSIMESSRVDV
uniref:Uncharacterized protein n=1 Tax=Oryza barthii TaxID=65489 RepID=A0A0D3HJ49_9ORYZ